MHAHTHTQPYKHAHIKEASCSNCSLSVVIYALVSEGVERMTLPVGRNGSSGSRTGALDTLCSRGKELLQ